MSKPSPSSFDAVVIGAGAAGLMAAAAAGQRGARVLLLDHNREPGAKILISGGGRCNFTNLDIRPERFVGENPDFARSALARYTQRDFVALVERYDIAYYEKTLGQLFCQGQGAAKAIVAMLMAEARAGQVEVRLGQTIGAITHGESFRVETSAGPISAPCLVIATGGLSIPKLGATAFAYRIAAQFGLALVAPRPALVPLVFGESDRAWMAPLSGLSVEAAVSCGGASFREGLLFTHRGLSGPSILQISTYWRHGQSLRLDLDPAGAWGEGLCALKRERPKLTLRNALPPRLPDRLAEALLARLGGLSDIQTPVTDLKDARLHEVAASLARQELIPAGDEGYAKAEVTAGGVSTAGLNQRTLEAKAAPGLYFIGEAVDITGWLGGYNFQWAWSSGWAAGVAIAERLQGVN